MEVELRDALVEDLDQLIRLHDRELDAETLAALRAAEFPNGLALCAAEEAGRAAHSNMAAALHDLPALDELAADYAAIYLTGAYGATGGPAREILAELQERLASPPPWLAQIMGVRSASLARFEEDLAEEDAQHLEPNAIGHVELMLQEPLPVAPFARSRVLGALILVDTATHKTSGAILLN